MLRQKATWLVGLALIAAQTADAAPANSVELSKKQRTELLEQVVPAYRLGEPHQLLRSLSAAALKLNQARLPSANELLAEHGVPPIAQLLADTRLSLVQQGLAKQLPKPNPRELLLTLRALDDRIQPVLTATLAHAVMSDPLPAPKHMAAYKQLFWSVHVLENQLENVTDMAEYAERLSKLGARLNRRSLGERDRQLLDLDYVKLVGRLKRQRQELEEREMQLRFFRLEDAESVLSQSNDMKERLLAAHALVMDSELLTEFLSKKDRRWIRQDLADPSLPESVKAIAKRGRTAGSELMEKGEKLAVALHWWLRGRYGAGPNAFGLVKAREAVQSPQGLFPLFMPTARPQPIDPLVPGKPAIPQVDRRHHYTWAVEYRPITTTVSRGKTTFEKNYGPERKQITHMSKFY